MCVLMWGPEEGMLSPGAEGTDACELPVCVPGTRVGPLEEQESP